MAPNIKIKVVTVKQDKKLRIKFDVKPSLSRRPIKIAPRIKLQIYPAVGPIITWNPELKLANTGKPNAPSKI